MRRRGPGGIRRFPALLAEQSPLINAGWIKPHVHRHVFGHRGRGGLQLTSQHRQGLRWCCRGGISTSSWSGHPGSLGRLRRHFNPQTHHTQKHPPFGLLADERCQRLPGSGLGGEFCIHNPNHSVNTPGNMMLVCKGIRPAQALQPTRSTFGPQGAHSLDQTLSIRSCGRREN